MIENIPSFDDNCISAGDMTANDSFSIKKIDEISPLTNYYVLPGEKRISKALQKLDKLEDERLKIIRSVLAEAQESYTVEHAQLIIGLARYYSKDLIDFNLSNEEENTHLLNIKNFEERKFGLESSQIEKMIGTIRYLNNLEQRLEKKGLMQKKSPVEEIVNRIARKDGDSV
jgi:hypothetical protein